ncbi:MAG: hypothetical protein ACT4ON_04325 [Bacteroidota bacterium]
MKKYKFILKPLFFICSLIFACWLVLIIEQVSPSDFGKYESLFKTKTNMITPIIHEADVLKTKKHMDQYKNKKEYLKRLSQDYKEGLIDSVKLNKELDLFLKFRDLQH